jgi:hypothetical protein
MNAVKVVTTVLDVRVGSGVGASVPLGLLGTSPVAVEERVGKVILQTPPLTTMISVEQAQTRDAVPLNVDVVISWRMQGAPSPVISDRQYRFVRLAQVAMREVVGASSLATLLCDRQMSERLLIDRIALKTLACGFTVCGLETCRLAIPAALQAEGDARSLAALRSIRSRHEVGADQAALAREQ